MNTNPDETPIVEVGEASFESEVLRSRSPVLVAFCAPWSRPCQILDSVLHEVATACAGGLKVVKVNADVNPDLSMWYEIQSIPTLLGFVEGTLRLKLVGTASREAIVARLRTAWGGGDVPPLTPDANQHHEHRAL